MASDDIEAIVTVVESLVKSTVELPVENVLPEEFKLGPPDGNSLPVEQVEVTEEITKVVITPVVNVVLILDDE